mgnify:CR=1 FL=1
MHNEKRVKGSELELEPRFVNPLHAFYNTREVRQIAFYQNPFDLAYIFLLSYNNKFLSIHRYVHTQTVYQQFLRYDGRNSCPSFRMNESYTLLL